MLKITIANKDSIAVVNIAPDDSNENLNEDAASSGANKGHEVFNQLDFLVRGFLFYPLGLLNLFFKRNYPSFSNDNYAKYLRDLPIGSIGCCWLWNMVVLGYIVHHQYPYGRDTILYWLYMFEFYFAQAVTAQVQLHDRDCENGGFGNYAKAILFGAHYENHVQTFCMTQKDYEQLTKCLRPAPISGSAELEHSLMEKQLQENHGSPQVTPPLQRQPVASFFMSKVVVIFLQFFILIVLVTSICTVDTRLLIGGIGYIFQVPETAPNQAKSITILPACRMNISANTDEEMARAFVGVRLSSEPKTARGLPIMNLTFYVGENDSSSQATALAVDEVWYATIYNISTSSVYLQMLDKQIFFAVKVSFPGLLCSDVAGIKSILLEKSSTSAEMDNIRLAPYSDWPHVVLFCIFIAFPTIMINSVRRSNSLHSVAMVTWDCWDDFNMFTTQSMFGDRVSGSMVPIDFSKAENCVMWYKVRQQFVKTTNLHLRVVLPLLFIALLELVWSLTAICWYFVLGKAPIPGFLLFICLSLNPLPMLVVLLPLYNIWKIQYSHIGMLTRKVLDLEMMEPDLIGDADREKAIRVLKEFKNVLEASDERLSILGFELSPSFLGTIGTIFFSATTFLLNGKVEFYARGGWYL